MDLQAGDGVASPNFVGAWMLEPPSADALDSLSICDGIVRLFEENPALQRPGSTVGGMNTEVKNSTDIIIHPKDIDQPGNEVFGRYMNALFDCYTDYLEQWPFAATFLSRVNVGSFNIQRYTPGGHFQRVHTERASISNLHRVFAWMTYLNDVEDGGATYFPHYDLRILPEAGKTLIWPAEWTHAHAGEVLNSGVKYIITGWMYFPFPAD